jgi:WD40 repeat protein
MLGEIMSVETLPPVLRSWLHLKATLPGLPEPEVLPIQPAGTTYAMVQELTWIDPQHFAVGRWDGSMSIFQFNTAPSQGPIISKAVNTPSAEGVQMITWVAKGMFATSNDETSVIVWRSNNQLWNDLSMSQTLTYSVTFGVANSGVAYATATNTLLVIGHANGFVTIWLGAIDGTNFQLVQSVDVRNAHPVNPWGIHNVRGVSLISSNWNDKGYVVTGSEDGDLCVIRIPDGMILSRTPYNPQAQRGINSIATLGANLLVANCAVGSADRNLWYYWINTNTWSIQLQSSLNLQIDHSQAQVFNFDVIWGRYQSSWCWFATTEEGYLWMGNIQNAQLALIGNRPLFNEKLGAAIGITNYGQLACAAYNLYEFSIQSSPTDLEALPEHRVSPSTFSGDVPNLE